MNHFIFTGHFGQDPELRHTNSGKPITTFSLARNTTFKGEKRTTWARFEAFGPVAENIVQYFKKGRLVRVISEFRNTDYTDKEGNSIRDYVFTVSRFEFPETNVPPTQDKEAEAPTLAPAPKKAPKAKPKPKVEEEEGEIDF